MHLVWPAAEHLPSYVAALEAGWSADTARAAVAAAEELERIRQGPEQFLAGLVDREARGEPVRLPDGSSVPRIPGVLRWMWDGEFCGSIGFRWQPGTEALPPTCMGHIGYAVVPWKQGRGYARQALAATLPLALAEGLRYVELTTNAGNTASQRVIEACGGVLHERFEKPPQQGGGPALRYRIALG